MGASTSEARRILSLVLGFACLAASIALYIIYSQIVVSIWPGIASVVAFSFGVYILRQEFYRWRVLKPFARILPFIIVGAFISIIIVGFGIQTQVADSDYASALSFISSRFAAFLFSLSGEKVRVSGDILYFPNGRALSVGPLCSGAYSSLLFGLLSVVMIADVGRNAPRGKLFVALISGLLFANLANVFRITFLASVMYLFGLSTLDFVHQFAGYAIFLAFISVFWIVSLRWLTSKRQVTLGTHG